MPRALIQFMGPIKVYGSNQGLWVQSRFMGPIKSLWVQSRFMGPIKILAQKVSVCILIMSIGLLMSIGPKSIGLHTNNDQSTPRYHVVAN